MVPLSPTEATVGTAAALATPPTATALSSDPPSQSEETAVGAAAAKSSELQKCPENTSTQVTT